MTLSFPIGILGQVWCLSVSIPDLCTLSYFAQYKQTSFNLLYANNKTPSDDVLQRPPLLAFRVFN